MLIHKEGFSCAEPFIISLFSFFCVLKIDDKTIALNKICSNSNKRAL